ncbi:hypothetical protein PoB_000970200 [Plakobranchus ocellatus]|uniref:Uncharacterized protein n=1 Tax=Plakobranchus ocellatus TaxID=259542 RepID=A0AAV3YM37_9GAST|nr:hypothetical protein PoB_000970200 [Plakobranchus ocellatus]
MTAIVVYQQICLLLSPFFWQEALAATTLKDSISSSSKSSRLSEILIGDFHTNKALDNDKKLPSSGPTKRDETSSYESGMPYSGDYGPGIPYSGDYGPGMPYSGDYGSGMPYSGFEALHMEGGQLLGFNWQQKGTKMSQGGLAHPCSRVRTHHMKF